MPHCLAGPSSQCGIPCRTLCKERILPPLKSERILSKWVESIKIETIRVAKFPSYIFLCGGKRSLVPEKFLSCRDIFYSYIQKNDLSYKNDILIAEEAFQFFLSSEYDDLLQFEQDLAELSALTIIFAESPGALAEFGSFSVMEKVQDKLLVVLHSNHANKESFIWRGPALYLQNRAKENSLPPSIVIYNWNREFKEDTVNGDNFQHSLDLSELVQEIIASRPKTEKFREDSTCHIMLLIVSVLEVLTMASIDELVYIIEKFKINKTRKIIKRYLNLLIAIKFIKRIPYGHNEFYTTYLDNNDWITWSYTTKSRDKFRWKIDFIEFYKDSYEKKYRAIKAYS